MSEPRATVRRAPRYGAFMIVGALVGLIVTAALTTLQPADPNVGAFALFAYFSLYGIPAGIAIGALLAMVLDAVSRRRARPVDVVIERGGDEGVDQTTR